MRTALQKWNAAPLALKAMLLEAALALAVARLLVMFVFRWIAPWLLRPDRGGHPAPPIDLARRIRLAVRVAARAVPWSSVCLPNALAAKMLLARRGFGSTVHLGVGHKDDHALHAHAWLEAAEIIVTGKSGMETVVPLSQVDQ